MFNCTRIHDVGYYDDQAAEAARDTAQLGKPLAYYGDNESDLAGIFVKLLHASPIANSPFGSIRTGAIADTTLLRRLAAGQDPFTGRQLVSAPSAAKRRKVVGYDLQISAPKSVSVLYALGSRRLRRAILSAHGRAILRALRYIETEGLIITRTGAQSQRHEPASEALAALYTHLLSRDLDPQIHTHAILLNVCVRRDGKTGAIDNHRLKQHGGAIAALYRCELASILHAELGVEIERDNRNFKLPIIPDMVVQLFSKRRKAIEAAAEAAGIDTATERSRAQQLSYKTRARKKKGLSLAELTDDWLRQADEAGFDHVSAMAAIETRLDREPSPGTATTSPTSIPDGILERIFENQALRTSPQIVCAVAEELQVSASADVALSMAEKLRSTLVSVDATMEGEPIYTSETLIRAEHELLRLAYAGRGTWHGVPVTLVESALDKQAILSDEQRHAVAYAFNSDTVVVVEGPPGAGKSHLTAAINSVATAAGLQLRVTAVSWQATHVVRQDAGVPTDRATALTPLLNALNMGRLTLSSRDVVIVDEAGMAGLEQVAALTRYCRDAGAKLVMLGDTRQLQPVAAGVPMRALTQLLGYGALYTIRRQEMEWMRQASMDLASSRAGRAIDTYDAAGAIAVHATREATLAAAAEEYLSHLPPAPSSSNHAMQSQLLITSRNDDVAELNRIVREGRKQRGQLGADEIIVSAIRRDAREGSPIDLPLSRGDRIIFGERVELGDLTLYNADIAQLIAIEPAPDGPVVTLALDRLATDGTPIRFTRSWKDLVSAHRESSHPIAQHAYATTVHAAQGATVDRAIVAMATAMSAEPLFVAMTRHRKALSMHVDAAIGKPREMTIGIALSQSGRLRGTDEAPEQAHPILVDPVQHESAIAGLKTQAGRSSPIDNPSRYISDIRSWIAAEDGVQALRRQLAMSKPVAAFKNRLQRLVSAQPQKPLVSHKHDPLALSPLERKQLDRVPLSAIRLGQRLGLSDALTGAGHPLTRERLRLRSGKPQWSRTQAQRIAASNASDEHTIVQIAVAILHKSVDAARAIVRQAFGLLNLNPLARAFARRLRQPSTQLQVSVPDVINRPHPVDLIQTRQRADEREELEDLERNNDFLRLAAQLYCLRSQHPNATDKAGESVPLSDADLLRSDRLTYGERAPTTGTSATSKASATAWSNLAIENILMQGRRAQQQQDEEDEELLVNQRDFLLRAQATLVRTSRPEKRSTAGARDVKSQDAGLQLVQPAPSPADKTIAPPTIAPSATVIAGVETAALAKTKPAKTSSTYTGRGMRIIEESKGFQRSFFDELDQMFKPAFAAAMGNQVNPSSWGGTDHIVRVNEFHKDFETLKREAKSAFDSLVQLQIDRNEPAESGQAVRHDAERTALANIYRLLMPSIERRFEPHKRTHSVPTARGHLSPRQSEELLAIALASRSERLDIASCLKLADAIGPFITPSFSRSVLLARAQVRAASLGQGVMTVNAIEEWAKNKGQPATTAAEGLLHALAQLPEVRSSKPQVTLQMHTTTIRSRGPDGR